MTPRPTRSAAARHEGRPPQAGAPRGRAVLAPTAWLLAALALIVCVGLADFLTGTDISLMLFYLAPIAFGTWYVHLRGGLFLAASAALVSTAGDALHRLAAGEDELPVSVLAWNGVVQVGTSVALVLMLAALRARLEAEELLARTDALTGIANRRAFLEAAELELERTRRHGRPLTVAYVDCDDLKRLNDRRGHAAGDALLVVAARTLRGATRAVDHVARLGGDEFGLLLPETDGAEAKALLSRLRSALLAASDRHAPGVGFSLGGATFLSPPASVEELMARADELMYAAKREEKGALRLGVFPGATRPAAGPGGAHLTS